MSPSRFLLLLSLVAVSNCLQVEVYFKVTSTFGKVMENTKTETTGMSAIINTHFDTPSSRCMKVCRVDTQKCFGCGLDDNQEQDEHQYVIRFIATTDKQVADFTAVAAETETSLAAIFGTVSPTRVNIAPVLKIVSYITVTATLEEIRLKEKDIIAITGESLGTASRCSLICDYDLEHESSGCYSCSGGDEQQTPTEKVKYTMTLFGETNYEEVDLPTISIGMVTPLAFIFGDPDVDDVTIRRSGSGATTPLNIVTYITVTATLEEIRLKEKDIIAITGDSLGTASRCSLICDYNLQDESGGCYSCSGGDEQQTPTEKVKYTMTLFGETNHEESDLEMISAGMLQPLTAIFGDGDVDEVLIRRSGSSGATIAPTPTPTPSPEFKTVVVEYSITLDFDLLVNNMVLFTTETQKALGGPGLGDCLSICSPQKECFTCGGVSLRSKISIQQSGTWSVTMKGTAPVDKESFVDDLDAALSPLIEALGGSLNSISATATVVPGITIPADSDDSLSGGAIAGIVIGSVCGVVLIVVIMYFACSRKTTQQDNTEMAEKSPDVV